jgi:hypothetical protein
MLPQEYIDVIRTGKKPVPQPYVSGLCGRILRGRPGTDDFEKLSDDKKRLVVMLTDSTGLSKFFGKTGYEMCVLVGHHPDHIKSKVEAGYVYKLVVFPESQGILATWDNVFKMAIGVYPDLTPYVQQHGNTLKSLVDPVTGQVSPCDLIRFENGRTQAFANIEALAGRKFMDCDQSDHPLFMTHEAWQKSQKGLVDLRALLYHTLHLRELYSGDGHTYDANGRKGVKEYLMLNQPILDIAGHVLHDLDVRLP